MEGDHKAGNPLISTKDSNQMALQKIPEGQMFRLKDQERSCKDVSRCLEDTAGRQCPFLLGPVRTRLPLPKDQEVTHRCA